MNDQTIEQEIQTKGLNAPRITPGYINELMEQVIFITVVPEGTTSTFAHAYLDGKFYLATGHSACVSPENFNAEIGQKIALNKAEAMAKDKLWELEGYRLYACLRDNTQPAKETQ